MPTYDTTPNMGLQVPRTLQDAGPDYAVRISANHTTIDNHTHAPGSGARIPAEALSIAGDVSWGGYSVTQVKATNYTQQSTVATPNSLWFDTSGRLNATNGSGVVVTITNGSGLNTSALITDIWKPLTIATNHAIGANDSYTHFRVDTSGARTITLPAASAVTAGRFYVVSDATGSAATNAITVQRAGSDSVRGGTSYVIDVPYGFAVFASDGTSAWHVVTVPNATASVRGVVALTQDLAGTAGAPTVVALTGSGGVTSIRSTSGTLSWANDTSAPTIKIGDKSGSAGTTLNITGQTIVGSGVHNGGGVLVSGGAPAAGGGDYGGVAIGSGSAAVSAITLSGARKLAGIHAVPDATAVPDGDGVTFIANATTLPTTATVGGGVLYSDAGTLKWLSTSGVVRTVALA